MSDIVEALKGEDTEAFWICDSERVLLCEILACVSVVLKNGKLHFNGHGEHNTKYAEFCDDMARRFANMQIEQAN